MTNIPKPSRSNERLCLGYGNAFLLLLFHVSLCIKPIVHFDTKGQIIHLLHTRTDEGVHRNGRNRICSIADRRYLDDIGSRIGALHVAVGCTVEIGDQSYSVCRRERPSYPISVLSNRLTSATS